MVNVSSTSGDQAALFKEALPTLVVGERERLEKGLMANVKAHR